MLEFADVPAPQRRNCEVRVDVAAEIIGDPDHARGLSSRLRPRRHHGYDRTAPSPAIGEMVVNRTGLTGTFSLDVEFIPPRLSAAPATSTDLGKPTLFAVLREQLGSAPRSRAHAYRRTRRGALGTAERELSTSVLARACRTDDADGAEPLIDPTGHPATAAFDNTKLHRY